ncbi:MAG: hypothetical protein ACLVJH_10325 [Faecalibacterium prausnitzii]
MLKAAKYGFLVENGSPALREEVPFLAPPNTSSGVMRVLPPRSGPEWPGL